MVVGWQKRVMVNGQGNSTMAGSGFPAPLLFCGGLRTREMRCNANVSHGSRIPLPRGLCNMQADRAGLAYNNGSTGGGLDGGE